MPPPRVQAGFGRVLLTERANRLQLSRDRVRKLPVPCLVDVFRHNVCGLGVQPEFRRVPFWRDRTHGMQRGRPVDAQRTLYFACERYRTLQRERCLHLCLFAGVL